VRNRDSWTETKFAFKQGKLVSSLDPNEVSPGSRVMVNLVAEAYQSALAAHCRGRLLDLGCGKVPLYAAYRDHVADVTCVDWADSLHGSQYLDKEVDLTGPLPFADAEFDTILLSDVLEHVPVPLDLWIEMARLLRPDGKVIVNVPFYYGLHEQPHDYYRYTEFALRRFVSLAGLKLVMLTPLGGAPEIIADIVSKNAMKIPRIGAALARVCQHLAWRFVRTGFGRRVSGATAENFPFGYFLVAQKA